jgi:hypothetical protein
LLSRLFVTRPIQVGYLAKATQRKLALTASTSHYTHNPLHCSKKAAMVTSAVQEDLLWFPALLL